MMLIPLMERMNNCLHQIRMGPEPKRPHALYLLRRVFSSSVGYRHPLAVITIDYSCHSCVYINDGGSCIGATLV
jgi:hypothetical protein